MHAEYLLAMCEAAEALDKYGNDLEHLQPCDAEKLLNTHWNLYWFALLEGDWHEAWETDEFIDELLFLMDVLGYKVVFTDHYQVQDQKGVKHV